MTGPSDDIYDVIIVGAGAAGVACARELSQHGLSFLILEARDRIGGRILTRSEPGESPIELGAEYLHGMTGATRRILERYNIPFFDVCDNHLFLKNGQLKKFPDFFERIEKVVSKISKRTDLSVADYFSKERNSPELQAIVLSFVEGFHAADPALMGTQELVAAMETDDEPLNGVQLFRLVRGYCDFLERIANGVSLESVLKLNTTVNQIDWQPGNVEIIAKHRGQPVFYRCHKVVVTVPLGVLKAEGAIAWNPTPDRLVDILSSMEMGFVERLALTFQSRFWENLHSEPIGYLHAGPEFYFPTWWTQMYLRTSNLIAWQGGPKAAEMASWTDERKVDVALATLSKLCGRSVGYLSNQLLAMTAHNWSADPCSRGAYSYVVQGGLELSKELAEPFENTIYFAGEATAENANRGTVHGAIESALRVSRQILSLEKNRSTENLVVPVSASGF